MAIAIHCWGANLMKGPVKLSLAIALALAGGNAFALGLGTIQVKSGLNQPLDAEIPVIADSPAEANGLTVDLASAEDFERVGLSQVAHRPCRSSSRSARNARGQTVIKLTTKEIVREPLLDFLIEVNWAKGKVLREYTVLLDPPITAPAGDDGRACSQQPVPERPRRNGRSHCREPKAGAKPNPCAGAQAAGSACCRSTRSPHRRRHLRRRRRRSRARARCTAAATTVRSPQARPCRKSRAPRVRTTRPTSTR